MKRASILAPLALVFVTSSAFATTNFSLDRELVSCEAPRFAGQEITACTGAAPIDVGTFDYGSAAPELVGRAVSLRIVVDGTIRHMDEAVTVSLGGNNFALRDKESQNVFEIVEKGRAGALPIRITNILYNDAQLSELGTTARIRSVSIRALPGPGVVSTFVELANKTAELIDARQIAYEQAKQLLAYAQTTGSSIVALRDFVSGRIAEIKDDPAAADELVSLQIILANIDSILRGNPVDPIPAIEANVAARRAQLVATISEGEGWIATIEKWKGVLNAEGQLDTNTLTQIANQLAVLRTKFAAARAKL